MDMSFSGILAFFEDLVTVFPHLKYPDPENMDEE